jgi:Carboxypeptidase regulatory-like domain
MPPVHWSKSVTVALGLAAIILAPVVTNASGNVTAIMGNVRDSGGVPIVGALVVVMASNPIMPQRMTFTDSRGSFSIQNLFAGEYSVKVTMPRFLPAVKSGIQVNTGHGTTLVVNLRNAMDVVRRAVSGGRSSQAEEILWTMRSSRSTQPILRLAESNKQESAATASPDYSGYFQVYSKSVETSTGTEEGVGSQFSLTMPVDSRSQVTLAGQYSELPTQPSGFGASYQFVPAERHRANIGVNVRQGSVFGDPLNGDLKEIQLEYGEDFQWNDHIVVNYGAEVGRLDAVDQSNYLRPRFSVSWVPQSRTTFTVNASSQAPGGPDDSIRGKDYFDRAAYIPPSLERYAHTEVIVSRVLSSSVDVSAAAFRDRTDTQALFVTSPNGRPAVLILDSSHSPSSGLRLHVNRQFKGFEGGLGYTTTSGLAISQGAAPTLEDLGGRLTPERFHVVTARFRAKLDNTQTEITAVYRWISAFSATRLDPYQRTTEYNDPSLSLSVVQNLPTFRMLPGKVQAILDARNLFERAYGTNSSQIDQYPRLVKGGINIKF